MAAAQAPSGVQAAGPGPFPQSAVLVDPLCLVPSLQSQALPTAGHMCANACFVPSGAVYPVPSSQSRIFFPAAGGLCENVRVPSDVPPAPSPPPVPPPPPSPGELASPFAGAPPPEDGLPTPFSLAPCDAELPFCVPPVRGPPFLFPPVSARPVGALLPQALAPSAHTMSLGEPLAQTPPAPDEPSPPSLAGSQSRAPPSLPPMEGDLCV